MDSKARAIVDRAYNGERNLFTPDVIDCLMVTPDVACEISSGEGMERGTTLYGVSFVHRHDGPMYGDSSAFGSLGDAMAHVRATRDRLLS